MFSRECKFIAGAAKTSAFPENSLPEVAFIGRSNVGKSSLLNAILGRKTLARVSQNPGCTRQINFFNLDDRILLVDLPGYGYARASKAEKAAFNHLVMTYLTERQKLQKVFVLIDIRRGLKESDIEIMSALDEYAVPYQLVTTKMDKVSKKEHDDMLQKITEGSKTHSACNPLVLSTSSSKKSGLEDLQSEIEKIAS